MSPIGPPETTGYFGRNRGPDPAYEAGYKSAYRDAQELYAPELARLEADVACLREECLRLEESVIPAAYTVVDQWRERNPFIGYAIEDLAHKLEEKHDA